MFSEKFELRGRTGIQRLDRVGAYLVITNRRLYEIGLARRYALVNEAKPSVHSVHGSYHPAVVFATKNVR
jgi:hypothetical protein